MTDTAPTDKSDLSRRLTVVEEGLKHSRELQQLQNTQTATKLGEHSARISQTANDLEVLEEKLLTKIEGVRELLWSGMKWLGAMLALTLLTIVLKALGLA